MEQRGYAIAQANLQRKELALQEILLEANKRKLAIALLQEPYVGNKGKVRNHRGTRVYQKAIQGTEVVKAAIIVFDSTIDVVQYPELTTTNIVVVKLRTRAWEILVVSFYFEPDRDVEPYLEHLEKIKRKVNPRKMIIGGDANAKNTWWCSNNIDYRGQEVAETIHGMDLQVLNAGKIPTFDTIRGNKRYTSHVDLTACTPELIPYIEKWEVKPDITSSDHNTITFKIHIEKSKGIKIHRTTRIYNTKKAKWDQFSNKLSQSCIENKINKIEIDKIKNNIELDKKVDNYIDIINKISEETIPKKRENDKIKIPWWTEQLYKMKKEALTKKRRIWCAAQDRRQKVVEEYLQAKQKYEHEIEKAKIESWKKFCNKQEREGIWEGIYRVIGRTTAREEDIPLIKGNNTLSEAESAMYLAETFYPEDKMEDDNIEHQLIRELAKKISTEKSDGNEDPPFTKIELLDSIKDFNPKKAPGKDGLTADICEQAIKTDPDIFLSFANKCLELGFFPTSWKEATIIILRKPNKENYTSPKSYRPIGLLPVMGKILEKMLINRLKWHVIPTISPRQYGFMPQKSTEDSLYDLMKHIKEKIQQKQIVVMVSLDIEGAFDSAWWPAILNRLADTGCPINIRRTINSYLENRKIILRYAGEEIVRKTNKGCVQGSIGGPILWNLLLDPVLKIVERDKVYCQAFADDIVVIINGTSTIEIETITNNTLSRVWDWGVRNKLKFAPHKTNAMVITRKLKYDTPRLSMGGSVIKLAKEIKILGLTIDNKLTFNQHVANVCVKATNFYKRLSRAAKISWGLHPEIIRTLYTAVVEPIIMYASNVWHEAANKIKVQKQLNQVQRGFAQKISKAYRTVSLHSALVLAGILPLDLRIQEAAALYEARKGVLQPTLSGLEMETRVPYRLTSHPAKNMAWEFVCLEDEEEVKNNRNNQIRIYTDGSKIEGKVGAALSLWSNEAETTAQKFKLPSYCTVYQAELLAILKATEAVLKSTATSFGIYSDSKSSLQSLNNRQVNNPIVFKIKENLHKINNQSKNLSLYWIKAHAGHAENERADQLAKEAAIKLKKKADYELCPISFVKSQIRLRTLDEWNRRYQKGETAAVTKLFFPDIKQAHKTIRKIKTDNIITQLLTGHGGFSEYLHRFKCKEDPSCICEPGVSETVQHVIFDCPMYQKKRYETELKIGNAIKLERAKELIIDKNFIEYCKKLIKIVIIRNKV